MKPGDVPNFHDLPAEHQIKAIQGFKNIFGPLALNLEKVMAACAHAQIMQMPTTEEMEGMPPGEALKFAMKAVDDILVKTKRASENAAAIQAAVVKQDMDPLETMLAISTFMKFTVDFFVQSAGQQINKAGRSWLDNVDPDSGGGVH